jgi:excisionase family DNA binding protein
MQHDELLTVTEAATVLKTTKDWLYRNANELPFTVRLSRKQLRFSAEGLHRWIQDQQTVLYTGKVHRQARTTEHARYGTSVPAWDDILG